ncbi:MAG: glycosyltransferase family 4 protein [Verrucomicrobia bacterium]|nr:glycosyltransferase family 4 protein [Verrucomicrobiota bacterium]MCF7708700.1 glycosyltransferase family 4 protein [Verrucomicrobiota bacterium]
MRLLVIHAENTFFGGAERMLGYFMRQWQAEFGEAAVACVKGSKTAELVPAHWKTVWIPDNTKFSPVNVWRQVQCLRRLREDFKWDIVHAWSARDWELAAVTGRVWRSPVVGALHDHPEADYIYKKRQWLMRLCARYGLDRTVCVSSAVREECDMCGYPGERLVVVRNGIPVVRRVDEIGAKEIDNTDITLGFLGVFSEVKGFAGLFEIAEGLWQRGRRNWRLLIGGGAADTAGEELLRMVKNRYSSAPWWKQIEWHGWISDPGAFFELIDVLIFPSEKFDSLPNVLLESGSKTVPSVASRVGGVPEIVLDGVTGWLFEAGDWSGACDMLSGLLSDRAKVAEAGRRARARVENEFSVDKMIAEFRKVYSDLI